MSRDVMTTADDAIELYEKVLRGELRTFPNHFWKGVEAKDYAGILTRYLLEKISVDPTEATKKTFQKNKLSSIIHLFGGSTSQIIENAYPGVYRPWELKYAP